MEEKKNRYHNGKIYCIRSHQTDMVYIGSTCGMLAKRLHKHRSNCKGWKNGKYDYMTSFEIVKHPDAYIELIEDYKCNNKMELNRKEGQIIRETENCVNKIIAGRTQKEWREDNRKKLLQDAKEYREEHKEEISQNKKQYYKNNKESIAQYQKQYNKKKYTCECGSNILLCNKAKHERSKKHKDFITN